MTVIDAAAANVGNDPAAVLAALPAVPCVPGNRLRLRPPRADDADAVFALFADPAVARYWSRPVMTARAEAEAQLARYEEGFATRESLTWAIAMAEDDALVGCCALFRIDSQHRRAEIGYALRADRWGQGLAREAVALMLGWSFDTLGLHRVEADIDPRNAASRGLLQRLGFRSEGLLRERYWVNDEINDTEWFGLLAREWRATAV
ncbi:MAG: GNAT family N-acetyltransferase [Lysobacter sp.]|nr:GNAT family N-acetyltransferase [Lysobacter sp.]